MSFTLLVLGGPAGAGKSTVSRHLHDRWPMTVLDKDKLCAQIADAMLAAAGQPLTDRDSEIYTQWVKPYEYDVLFGSALRCAQQGHVLVDAPCVTQLHDQQWQQTLRHQAAAQHTQVLFAWLSCQPDVLLQRLRRRGYGRDHRKLQQWATFVQQLPTTPTVDVVLDSTDHSPEDLAEQLLLQILQFQGH